MPALWFTIIQTFNTHGFYDLPGRFTQIATMSVVSRHWLNLTLSVNVCNSDSILQPTLTLVEQSSCLSSRKPSQNFCKLLYSSDARAVKRLYGARAFSSTGVPADTTKTSSPMPPPDFETQLFSEEDSPGGDDLGMRKDAGQDLRINTARVVPTEKVVISTTRSSRTARVLSQEPEYISKRYVKGSLEYEIGVSESVCVGKIGNNVDENTTLKLAEELNEERSREEVASTSGDDRGWWTSESYLKQALKQRQRYREVVLRFSSDDFVAERRPWRNAKDEDKDSIKNNADLKISEEELYLQQVLESKRKLATEILESSLCSGQLSPSYTKSVLSFMAPFIDRIIVEAVALKDSPNNKNLSFNSRARLYISECKVVAIVKWLKHMRLTVPRIGKLICIADENLGLITSRVAWLKAIYVTGRDLGAVIEKQPRILYLSLEDLNKTIELLEVSGVQRKWLGLVVSRAPKVLITSRDELRRKIKMFTDLGISPEKFGIMVFNFPAILGRFSVEEMQSKVEYLRQIGIDDVVLAKIIASTPQLLACSIEQAWAKILKYFYFLQIELAGVRRIIGVNPSVFCLDLEENIAPKVKFLRAIGVHEEMIGQVIVNFPAFLTYSLDKKIRPVVKFLLEEANVTEEKVGKVITFRPELIRCSLPNKLRVLVQYFKTRMIRAEQLGRMVEDFPALLMYSVPVLHPKFQYLTRVMKRPLIELVAFPRFFSYALKSRIIPRHELLTGKGLTFTLKYMLACSDDTFNTRVAQLERNGLQPGDFKEEADPDEDEVSFDEETEHLDEETDG